MTKKKESLKSTKAEKNTEEEGFGAITTKADLKTFLLGVRDRMTDEVAAPIYAVSAMNFVMNLPDVYNLLDNECKEIARDIWLRLKQAGLQLRSPVLFFGAEAASIDGAGK